MNNIQHEKKERVMVLDTKGQRGPTIKIKHKKQDQNK